MPEEGGGDGWEWLARWQAERDAWLTERAVPVVCELCLAGQCAACVRPCTCRHGVENTAHAHA